MPTKENAEIPDLPKEFPHIFTEVVFQLIPEVDYNDLVYLSQLLKMNNKREEIYRPLTDTLRKIQRTKLASTEAVAIEKETVKLVEEGVIVFHPVGQAQYAKAVCDFIFHAKSALDSLAVFLTELLSIPAKGGDQDFKKKKFRDCIIQEDTAIGESIKSLEQWFIALQGVRDKWIHRITTRIFMTFGPTEIGLLPIPKAITEDYKIKDVPLRKENYWTTQEFIDFHFTKLTSLFRLIVARCIEIERDRLGTTPPTPQKSTYPIIAFPIYVADDMKLKEIRLRW